MPCFAFRCLWTTSTRFIGIAFEVAEEWSRGAEIQNKFVRGDESPPVDAEIFIWHLKVWEQLVERRFAYDAICNACEQVGEVVLDPRIHVIQEEIRVSVDEGVADLFQRLIALEQVRQLQVLEIHWLDFNVELLELQVSLAISLVLPAAHRHSGSGVLC